MSQDPPPLPPLSLNYAAPQSGYIDLRTIAMRQKGIMYCLLGYIMLIILVVVVPAELKLIVMVLAMGLSVTAAVFVFMLSMAVFNTGMGIFLGILTLVPIVGLVALLIVNGKATSILRQHGIRVGLMGANSKQIPARI